MKQKTLQEKKALSYAKDCRNDYGANDKASRKNIPLRKAKSHRSYRKKVNDLLHKTSNLIEAEEIEIVENEVKSVRKDNWKKDPDERLEIIVKSNLENRELHAGKGKTLRKKEREIIESMEINTSQKDEKVWVAKVEGFHNLKAEGNTRNEAIGKVKVLVQVAIQNSLGLDREILINGKLIRPILEED
ncbi:MAG TPA: hypothetical protein PKE69_05310 [Pyrinomonadaceae bacterium]|nr:hypothetical protein [Pyrinomonadaceae bacterium]